MSTEFEDILALLDQGKDVLVDFKLETEDGLSPQTLCHVEAAILHYKQCLNSLELAMYTHRRELGRMRGMK